MERGPEEASVVNVVGIFNSRAQADTAAARLKATGIADRNINLLTPGASEDELRAVPTETMEAPGVGKTLGGVVGGALGAATANALVPGVGAVTAMGIAAMALFAAGGAA